MADKTFEANIYTPDWSLIAVLKDYISIIWTDRYYEAGDFELILPLTKENLQIYSVDNYIICNQSDKVMIIETVVTSAGSEGYKMKVTGHSAEILLKRRITANELLINANTNNEKTIYVKDKKSHFAGALVTAFENCFLQEGIEMMSESNAQNAIQNSSVNRKMNVIRFAGVISDPFNHIVNAIGNIDSYGDEYYDIIQSQCESKDIGFAIYRNFERPIDRSAEDTKDLETLKMAKYFEASSFGLFDLVLYDGWNQTGKPLNDSYVDMDITIDEVNYDCPNGVTFSVEYLNLQSMDSNYSKEDYKNYIFVRGDEINKDSSASVDVAEATANFTQVYTDEDSKYYLVGTESEYQHGIFRRETFAEAGFSRGLNTRRKYASRLRAKGLKLLKDRKARWKLSCEIGNVYDYVYRHDYYLGDLVLVKDSMNNSEVFRVTEEIISSDSSGLKMYPTLVLFDPYKYVEDDSLEDVDDSSRVAVEWNFDGGLLALDQIEQLYLTFISSNPPPSDPNKWPANTTPGTIIGIKTNTTPWNYGLSSTPGETPNWQELQKRLTGVITYQIVGDYIAFPSLIGDVSNDPNVLGDYNLEKEHYELRYWQGMGSRFIKHIESTGVEEGTECYGWASFDAHWAPICYRITFNHGNGGRFGSSAFSSSFCHINEIEQWQSTAPPFEYGKYYEKVRDWYRDTPYYRALYSPPPGWDNPNSSTYYTNYYANSKDTDLVFEDVEYNKKPSPLPYCVADSGYTRDKPEWEPEIVPAIADATYTAKWKKEDEDEDEEEPDDDDEEKKDDPDRTSSPVKHHEGKTHNDIYIGDENTNNLDFFGIGMVTFRSNKSRLFDDYGIVNGTYQKKADAEDQHTAFRYLRNIGKDDEEGENGSTAVLDMYWSGSNSTGAWPYYRSWYGPGLSIRRGDGAVMMAMKWATGDTNGLSAGLGVRCAEIAFTNAPVVKKIMGLKALTYDPLDGKEEGYWPNNIYDHNGTKITSKPSDWDTHKGWRNYCKYTQIGARYGFTCQGYDDLGLLYTPLWVRAGIVDHPIIPFVNVSGNLYDITYTSNTLQIATAYTKLTNYDFYGPIEIQMISHYNMSGWQWATIPDGRWTGPKSGTEISGTQEFVWTGGENGWGAMFKEKNGDPLSVMPENWGTEGFDYSNYEYVSGSSYYPITGLDSRYYGPYYGNTFAYYTGQSKAGPRLILPKKSGAGNSIIVTITGWTAQQWVKPGKTATFKVNAFSLIISAKLTYQWKIKMPGTENWINVESGGSVYSFVAKEEQNGMELKCTVTASYSAFDETISGEEDAPNDGTFMHLIVNSEGSDGTKPNEQEEQNEKDLENSTEPTEANGNGNGWTYEWTDKNSGQKYKVKVKWAGSGNPPAKAPTLEEALADPNWEVDGPAEPIVNGDAPKPSSSSSGNGGGNAQPAQPKKTGDELLKEMFDSGEIQKFLSNSNTPTKAYDDWYWRYYGVPVNENSRHAGEWSGEARAEADNATTFESQKYEKAGNA